MEAGDEIGKMVSGYVFLAVYDMHDEKNEFIPVEEIYNHVRQQIPIGRPVEDLEKRIDHVLQMLTNVGLLASSAPGHFAISNQLMKNIAEKEKQEKPNQVAAEIQDGQLEQPAPSLERLSIQELEDNLNAAGCSHQHRSVSQATLMARSREDLSELDYFLEEPTDSQTGSSKLDFAYGSDIIPSATTSSSSVLQPGPSPIVYSCSSLDVLPDPCERCQMNHYGYCYSSSNSSLMDER